MKHIVVAIDPHEDGVRCEGCFMHADLRLCGMSVPPDEDTTDFDNYERGPLCLAAEAKLTALIEAGDHGTRSCNTKDRMAWLNAVAEVEGRK